MKRVMAPALLSLLALGGCGSSDIPNTQGNCKGVVTVNASVPAALATKWSAAKFYQADVVNTRGERFTQPGTPPLTVPNVTVTLPGATYSPGQYSVRLVAADVVTGSGNTSVPTSVSAVGRAVVTLQDACPSPVLTIAEPTNLSVCFDKCDADLRCGKKDWTLYSQCVTASCQANADQFTSQQNTWVSTWAAYLLKNKPADNPDQATATANAKKQVQILINQLEACNLQACTAVDSCGAAILAKFDPNNGG